MTSNSQLEISVAQRSGATTIFSRFLFDDAAHQEKVLFAMMWCLQSDESCIAAGPGISAGIYVVGYGGLKYLPAPRDIIGKDKEMGLGNVLPDVCNCSIVIREISPTKDLSVSRIYIIPAPHGKRN